MAIAVRGDNYLMAAYFIIGFLLLAGPLALLYGADSRTLDTRDRRRWWPGAPRS